MKAREMHENIEAGRMSEDELSCKDKKRLKQYREAISKEGYVSSIGYHKKRMRRVTSKFNIRGEVVKWVPEED